MHMTESMYVVGQAVSVTGKTYAVGGDSAFDETEIAAGGTAELTDQLTTHVTLTGETSTTTTAMTGGDDFLMHTLTHTTVNSNGDVTADVVHDNPFLTCR
jgi:hypothetical protein